MWLAPSHPVIVQAAERVFRDGSPWLPLLPAAGQDRRDLTWLLEHNLIAVPALNRHVIKTLADRRPAGELEMGHGGSYTIQLIDGGGRTTSAGEDAISVPPDGTRRRIRMADWYAWRLVHRRPQAPRFEPFWTDAERDAALPAIAAWVASRAGKLADAP
jgi:hypothetical protein